LRSPKGPFEIASPGLTLDQNLIGSNSGNLVFLEASHRLLATRGSSIEVDRFAPHLIGIDQINERYDVYVVPLASAFRRSFVGHLSRLTTVIRQLRIPVVVLGVGAQTSIDYDTERLSSIAPVVKAFVSAVLDRGPSIGVRGELTADYLSKLGFRDVEVIGCPSLFLNGPNLAVRDREPSLRGDARIALNVSPYLEAMGPIIARHLALYPRLTYFAQDLDTLRLLVDGEGPTEAAQSDALPRHWSHPLLARARTRLHLDPWPWIDELATYDFAFGSRIHGNFAAVLAGTPAFVLAHDSRTLELARYFEMPHAALSDVSPNVDAADLYAAADSGPMVANHRRRFETFARYLSRHGLSHVFEPGQNPTAFMADVASTAYPLPATADRNPYSPKGDPRRVGRRVQSAVWGITRKRLQLSRVRWAAED
jgi:hypothetical protein